MTYKKQIAQRFRITPTVFDQSIITKNKKLTQRELIPVYAKSKTVWSMTRFRLLMFNDPNYAG